MELHEFLRSRRSIRRFKPEPIPRSVLLRIITTATFAPSAHDRQPWRFAVLSEQPAKIHLANAMASEYRSDLLRDNIPETEVNSRLVKSRARFTSSPAIILLCMDTSEMDVYPDARRAEAEKIMAVQSAANAGMQLLLAVHAEGLGGVWTCGPLFIPNIVRDAFSLPNSWEPQGMFLIGYPAETPRVSERKPIGEILRFL